MLSNIAGNSLDGASGFQLDHTGTLLCLCPNNHTVLRQRRVVGPLVLIG